ncbi:FUSC family protein [Micromonospora yasonensis]|uniref:FUSC family protein n=1 Tax=Micromonospora yasonensis TaxID=1128667 RepID=UPI00223031E4|nr:FUSC family protein [Micromonospora yasonensis]MCW3839084.1 FUSC family protein [Micromonospora yasonensis]
MAALRGSGRPAERSGRARVLPAVRRFLATRQLAAVAVVSVQAGLATAAAWIIAMDFLGRDAPVFAPVAALATIASATGQRTRQTVELLIGVGLGITVADILLYFIGSGAWQIAVVVSSSVALGLLVAGRSGALVSQAGATATLFATLAGNQRSLELPRIIDAAVGTSIGFLAVALLLPLDPLGAVDRAAKPFFTHLAAAIHTTAQALATGDRDRAMRALDSFDEVAIDSTRLNEALRAAEENVTIAPWWRRRRDRYRQYRAAVDQLDGFTTDIRVMIRRIATLLEYREPVPRPLHRAVDTLGDALAHLHRDCTTAQPSGRTHQCVLEAARLAGYADRHQPFPFGEAVVLQIRSAASDLLRAAGVTPQQANRLVREAATKPDGR